MIGADAGDEPTEPLDDVAGRAAGGDRVALDELLGTVRPQVLQVCHRMLPCREDAEEACQDALLRIATGIDRFEGRSRVRTWVYAIAANSARQTYRARKRRSAERPVQQPPETVDPRTTSVIAGSRLDLLEALESLEAEHPDLAEAVVLRDVAQLDYSQIARLLNLPLGTVKSRIHTARQRLKPLLMVSG